MAISRRGLFKRAVVVAAAAPLGMVATDPRHDMPADTVVGLGSDAPMTSGFDRKMQIEALMRATQAGIISADTAQRIIFHRDI